MIRHLLLGRLIASVPLLVLSSPLFAADVDFTPHADLRLSEIYYPDNVSPVVNQTFEMANLQLPTELRWGSAFSFRLRPELQADPWNNSITERYWAELPEGYLQIKPLSQGSSTLSVQAGFNTFSWGVTDGFNPLDVVSARRFEDPVSPEKLGAPSIALHAELPGGTLSFDGIYIPRQRRAILPGNKSRWLPREQFQSQSETVNNVTNTFLLPNTTDYYYQDSNILDQALQNNFGFKGEAHLPSVDLSMVFFEGEASLPVTDISASGNVIALTPTSSISLANPDIGITPVYYRQIVTGGSVVYTLGEFIFRAEAAFTRLISKELNLGLPGLSNEYVGEVEHAFAVGAGTLTAFAEGTYAQHQEVIDPSFVSLARIFDRAVALGARYAPNETFLASALLLEDTEFHGNLVHLDLSDSLSDSIRVSGTGEIITGKDGTPTGNYRYNSRALVSLKYSM
ncbi:MAG: hypothetical protein P4M08_14975 [Oligoflexia bacterium]|nr:hypothetical protein [Oligoflexia bacterium]